nr:hypothetical protein Iba_chr07cCG6340 [Ipomoea batatas]
MSDARAEELIVQKREELVQGPEQSSRHRERDRGRPGLSPETRACERLGIGSYEKRRRHITKRSEISTVRSYLVGMMWVSDSSPITLFK